MNYNTITLPNGLRIIHLHAASPVVYCGYEINAGTRDEEHGEEGMAHFCEHITFKGTERRRALQILNCLESVGGDLNAFTNKESTVYYSAVLSDHFQRAVDLLTDIVFHSIYPQTEIDKEVAVICDEIESYNDSPAELIFDEFEGLIFKNHPLGHNILGKAEQLRTYKTADAKRFTSKFYRPENAVFFAYGDIDFKKLVYLLRKATMGFPERKPIINKHTETVLPVYEPQNVTVERHTHQAHVMMGNRAYSVNNDKRIALYLLNNILGGPGMNARLNLSLRERHGLVYTVESSMISYSDTGLWCVYFGCDQHDIKNCLRLVRHELDKLMEKPMTVTQLNAAKKQIKGQIAIACDNRESFALDFGKSYLHYGWEKNTERLFANIDALTAKQLQEVALDIFAQNRMTTLIYQ
ncbi:M16 family metallopeptidase [Xylanibacter muris]|uniref:Insulinase family protein n=1 Tax=Xylanibacter muris TaxID=2736290 RepID=A0ABX2AJ42_9BACT|nr:pitrilysin family protein [Xylanibacter muris]NPD90778.1 insulinase family protein [Xylanibacter muris]